ncbi:MAG: hypothetical protein AAB389_04060 [Patescibacteria group bacterium]
MFGWIGSILSGIVYVGGVLLWNLGLIAAPALPEHRVETAALIQQIPAEVAAVKDELAALKQELAELKQAKVVVPAPAPKPAPAPTPKPKPKPAPAPIPVLVPVPVSVPVPAPAPVPAAPALAPGTFMTPSGAIVDANGNLISAPPGTAPAPSPTPSTSPAPTPAPSSSWPPATGSTVIIGRHIAIAVSFNPGSACNQLGFGGQELKLCELYKNSESSYIWAFSD